MDFEERGKTEEGRGCSGREAVQAQSQELEDKLELAMDGAGAADWKGRRQRREGKEERGEKRTG